MISPTELQQLVLASRDPSAAQLSRLPEVATSARHLLQDIRQGTLGDGEGQCKRQDDLLLCYRVLRNSAAAGRTACAALLRLGLLDLVRSTLDLISTATISLNWHLPAVVGQALANLCNACGDSAAATWAALFPLHLGMLAHVNEGRTQAASCLSLLACCKVIPEAATSLAGPQGGQMMTALLCNYQRMMQQGEHNGDLGLLAAHLCFAQDLLPNLFQSVGPNPVDSGTSSSGSYANTLQPTLAQATLLHVLCAEAHEMPEAELDGAAEAPPAATASMYFLVQLAEQLATASVLHRALSEGQQQVLQDALHLIRGICARDDSGCKLAGGGNVVAALQAAGLLPALLAMLKALEPIQNPQRQKAAAMAAATTTPGSSGIQVAELAPSLAQRAQCFPAAQPYQGFRTDLLAAVANATYGRPAVQSEVCALGGVELVLAQCQLDRHSPLAREWALWGVRNLCEGNAQAQEAIRQLQLCTTVDNEELKRMGVRMELDEHSGKLRVIKRESDATSAAAR